jgi:MFS family permease
MSFNTEFFAPPMATVPRSGPAARTTMLVILESMIDPVPRIRSSWPSGDPEAVRRLPPRDDVVLERAGPDGSYEAVEGPFRRYHRRLHDDGRRVEETIDFALGVPWWSWLLSWPSRAALRARPRLPGMQPWWAPPDRLDATAARVLGLVCAVAVAGGYLNTLFTQTVAFAADSFGTGEGAQGVAGAVVRFGLVFAFPLVLLADRQGRRRMLVISAVLAPLLCSLGAVAPSFAALTASQTLGRPVAIVLMLLVGVVAAEEMPAGGRAYAVSVIAMAGGLGAGLCVLALPLADVAPWGWRLIYVLPLAFLVLAVDLHRRLPETRRFATTHAVAPRFPRRRFALLALSAFLTNLLVAPASFFQNRYLRDVRGYSAATISLFTLATNTPAGIGIVAGGRIADTRGRRRVAAVGLVVGATATVGVFVLSGSPMWVVATVGSVVGAAAVPALGVYGAELFPTGHRGKASGFISALSLIGSSIGLVLVGQLIDGGRSYGTAMAVVGGGPLVVAVLVLLLYPETAHVVLEDLNPEDRLDPSAPAEAAEPPDHR